MSTDDRGDSTVSRRAVLGGAGAAIVGGLVASQASPATAAAPHGVGRGRAGTMIAEFRARIAQRGSAGEDFSSVGYLSRLSGAADTDLFAGTPMNETTALLTAIASGNLVARVLDENVHLLDVVGSLIVHQRSAPGATWADPASFAQGTVVARYDLTIQDVVSVFAPAKGMLDLTADMRQTFAGALSGGLAGMRFGRTGDLLRQHGTGLGTLVDPVQVHSDLELAGSWTAVDQPGG
jgi:hypothetical protein